MAGAAGEAPAGGTGGAVVLPDPVCGDGIQNQPGEECDEPYEPGRCLPGMGCQACTPDCKWVDGEMKVAWTRQTQHSRRNDYQIRAADVDIDDMGNVFVGLRLESPSTSYRGSSVLKYDASGALAWSYFDEHRNDTSYSAGALISADRKGGAFFLSNGDDRYLDHNGILRNQIRTRRDPDIEELTYSTALANERGGVDVAGIVTAYRSGQGDYIFLRFWFSQAWDPTDGLDFYEPYHAPPYLSEDPMASSFALDGGEARTLFAPLEGSEARKWRLVLDSDNLNSAPLELPPLDRTLADFDEAHNLYVLGEVDGSPPVLFKLDATYAQIWSQEFDSGAVGEALRTQDDGSVAVGLREAGQLKVVRFDGAGNRLSTVSLGNQGHAIAINKLGQIAVAPRLDEVHLTDGVAPSALATTQLYDGYGQLLWERTHEQASHWDEVLSLDFDESGVLHAMTGAGPLETSFSTIDAGGSETSQSFYNAHVPRAELGPSGEFLWIDPAQRRVLGFGPSGLSPRAVTTPDDVVDWDLDPNGDVYARTLQGIYEVGESSSSLVNSAEAADWFRVGAAGSVFWGTAPGWRIYVTKANLSGAALWEISLECPDEIDGIFGLRSCWLQEETVDSKGNLYLVTGGEYREQANSPELPEFQYLLWKVTSGGEVEWVQPLDVGVPRALIADDFGRIFVGGVDDPKFTSDGDERCAIQQFRASGVQVGDFVLPADASCRISTMALAKDGRIAIGGSTRKPLFGHPQIGEQDAFLMMIE